MLHRVSLYQLTVGPLFCFASGLAAKDEACLSPLGNHCRKVSEGRAAQPVEAQGPRYRWQGRVMSPEGRGAPAIAVSCRKDADSLAVVCVAPRVSLLSAFPFCSVTATFSKTAPCF